MDFTDSTKRTRVWHPQKVCTRKNSGSPGGHHIKTDEQDTADNLDWQIPLIKMQKVEGTDGYGDGGGNV